MIKEALDSYVPVQNRASESFTITGFNLIPLEEVNKRSRDTWNNSLYPGLHPAAVLAPLVMTMMMLLIASFNFANTAIASAGKRLMEIGIRKVVGGERKHVLFQFLIENYIICFLAGFQCLDLHLFGSNHPGGDCGHHHGQGVSGSPSKPGKLPEVRISFLFIFCHILLSSYVI